MNAGTDAGDAADAGSTPPAGGQGRGDVRPPDIAADEKTTLLTFLDYLRESVVAKAEGVPERDARAPGVPSGTSLLGLVKHLTGVELNWFVWAYAGEPVAAGGPLLAEDPPAEQMTPAEMIAAYRDAVRRSNAVVAACADLGRPGVHSLRENAPPPSLRWILVHMIEETARHAGHADILREHLDGSVGR